jgi:hypothetical protein
MSAFGGKADIARLVSGEISMLKPVSGSKNDSQRDQE